MDIANLYNQNYVFVNKNGKVVAWDDGQTPDEVDAKYKELDAKYPESAPHCRRRAFVVLHASNDALYKDFDDFLQKHKQEIEKLSAVEAARFMYAKLVGREDFCWFGRPQYDAETLLTVSRLVHEVNNFCKTDLAVNVIGDRLKIALRDICEAFYSYPKIDPKLRSDEEILKIKELTEKRV